MRVAEDAARRREYRHAGPARPPVKTAPIEPGYSYHSETNMDLMQPVLSALAEAYEAIDLPLRSIENEWGPGQVECTFAARDALEAADNHACCSAPRPGRSCAAWLLRDLHVPARHSRATIPAAGICISR